MLTKEELARMRSWWNAQTARGVYPHDMSKLLDFAEEMLPLRDALLALLAAEKRKNYDGGWRSETTLPYLEAKQAFWALARKLAETDGATDGKT